MYIARCFGVILFLLFLSQIAFPQQLKLGKFPYDVEKSAVLELKSDNQGLLLPRIADTALINTLSPPDGMAIFFIPTSQLLLRVNGHWEALGLASSLNNYWSVNGNSNGVLKQFGNIDDYSLPFITNNTERMRIDNLGNIGIGTSSFDATNPEKLLIDAGTTASYNLLKAKGNINGYLQFNIQNESSGNAASTDIVATANNGSEGAYYVNLGINSSTYSNTGILGGADNAYLYSAANDFIIGNSIAGKNLRFFTGGTSTTNERLRIDSFGRVGIGVTAPTAILHLKAGTASVNTAPLKFTSGALLTTAEAGGVEFLTDKFYGTITTGAARKEFTLNNATLTTARVPFATTNGRLTDLAAFTYTTNRLSPTYITLGAGAAAAGSAPLVFTSGVSLTTPIAGAMEFTTDNPTFTIATGVSRKQFTLNDAALTSGRVPYTTTNGRLIDNVSMTYAGNRLSPTYLTLAAGTAAVGTAPLVMTTGVNLTTPLTGAIEFDGTHFYGTVGATRYQFDQQTGTTYTGSNGITLSGNDFRNDLITGIAGGQTITGGIAAGNSLTLSSTNHATKGNIIFGTSAYDEVNNRLGIGNSTPSEALDVTGNLKFSGALMPNNNAGTSGYLLRSNGAGTSPSWINLALSNLSDAAITSPAGGQILQYNGTNWINYTPNYLTTIDTSNISNFYQKVRGLFSGTAPVTFNAAGQIGITQATTSTNGYLNSTDWNTFNSKGSGNGTVTSASVVTANGVSGTVATATTTPAITLTLGAITPTSVAATGTVTGSNLSGTNTGNVTIGTANGLSLVGQALSLGLAGTSATGSLSNTDWNTFNNKLSSIDTTSITNFSQKVRSLFSGTAPITYNAGVIGISQANTSTDGYLNSTDWNTFNNKLATTRTISTTAPLQGGGDLSANRTLSITDAAADGTTKGASTYTAADFNSATGLISIDYTNGQAASGSAKGFLNSTDWTTFNNKLATTRTISTTAPLQGGGDLSANRTLSITDAAADGTTKGASTYTAADFNTTTGLVSIDYTNGQAASGSTKGFLTSADWNTFNNKASASNLWSVTGNSGTSYLTNFLGTTDNRSLRFRTNNTERFIIDSTGNTGIGTSAFNATYPERLFVDAGSTGNTNYQNVIVGKGNTNSYAQLNIQNGNAGTAASSDVVATADNGNETVNFIDMGINSSVNSQNYFGGLNDAYLYAIGNGVNAGGNLYIGTATASRDIAFLTGGGTKSSGVTMNNERMRILGTGNVGIANGSPTEKLDITGNLKFSGALLPGGVAGTAGTFLMSMGSGTAPTWFDASNLAWQVNGNSVPSIETLGTTNAYDLPFITNNTEKMRITSAGTVGIGTSTFNATNPEELIVDAGATGNTNYQNVIVGKGNTNSYAQLNIQNTYSAAANSASSDVVATSDNGTESVNFIDMGINSGTNTTSGVIGGANTAYLYTTGGNLALGTSTASKDIVFFTGTSYTDRMHITSAGHLIPTANNAYNLGSASFRWSTIYSQNVLNVSDARLKKNIRNLNYGLSAILNMHPVQYNWKEGIDKDNKIGFLAQELRTVIPEVVVGDESKENLAVNYIELIPVLVNAIKEQQKQIDDLTKKVKMLERK